MWDVARIRREHFIKGDDQGIARLKVSRHGPQVLRSGGTSFVRARGSAATELDRWCDVDELLAGRGYPAREQLTLIRVFGLRGRGYEGGYVPCGATPGAGVGRGQMTAAAYVPLACSGRPTSSTGATRSSCWWRDSDREVAHFRLCHSRMLFVRAYPREAQEMVFDAHDRAFALFRAPVARHLRQHGRRWRRSSSEEPALHRRFLQMCSHYLVDPVACTPASGWEKGRSRIRSGSSVSASSRHGCGSDL